MSALPLAEDLENALMNDWKRCEFPCARSPKRVRYSVISPSGTFAAIRPFVPCAIVFMSNGVQKLNF